MDVDSKVPALLEDDSKVTLTIRLIMQGKEVGSIIGKKGEIVKRFREESGAKINISDGSCPERIVTVTGTTNAIFKAFTLICKKFEEWCTQFNEAGMGGGGGGGGRSPITLRLIVPASQCGSLIGKGGSKIKEIRDVTTANIQVASEMLPHSTERAVTVSGTSEAITQCIYHICCVMLESPPKGATIPYRPKPQVGGPVILAGGQAYTIQGNYAVPTQDAEVAELRHTSCIALQQLSALRLQAASFGACGSGMFPVLTGGGGGSALLEGGSPLLGSLPPPHLQHLHHLQHLSHSPLQPLQQLQPLPPHLTHLTHHQHFMGGMAKSQLGLAALGLGGLAQSNAGPINPVALAALAGSQLRTVTSSSGRGQPPSTQQSHEMTVPNELIGCIIGKGGTKIAEIRQISGAMIRISNCEEREGGSGSGNTDRTITITGNPDAVALAQYLINMSVELQKAADGGNSSSSGSGSGSGSNSTSNVPHPLASAIPLAQLLAKPGALGALTSLSALSGITDLLGGALGSSGSGGSTGGRSHKLYARRANEQNSSHSETSGKSRSERSKFNPY